MERKEAVMAGRELDVIRRTFNEFGKDNGFRRKDSAIFRDTFDLQQRLRLQRPGQGSNYYVTVELLLFRGLNGEPALSQTPQITWRIQDFLKTSGPLVVKMLDLETRIDDGDRIDAITDLLGDADKRLSRMQTLEAVRQRGLGEPIGRVRREAYQLLDLTPGS
jgi:hypothetical protein